MFFIIYKITNNINNKIYIGKHQTNNLDDDYMGSGKHLKRAIKKYGIENFSKEILFIFDNEFDMNSKEKELVTPEFIKEDTNYNLCPGGQGGFGYINEYRKLNPEKNPMKNKKSVTKRIDTINIKYSNNHFSKIGKKGGETLKNLLKDNKFKDEFLTKHKNGLPINHQKGVLNSQFGKKFKFMNNGYKNIKVDISIVNEFKSKGYVLGRIKTK